MYTMNYVHDYNGHIAMHILCVLLYNSYDEAVAIIIMHMLE